MNTIEFSSTSFVKYLLRRISLFTARIQKLIAKYRMGWEISLDLDYLDALGAQLACMSDGIDAQLVNSQWKGGVSNLII